MDPKRKTIVIGLDGATFTLLAPLLEKGKMPFLQSLKEKGCHAELRSTVPPLTSPAWVSFSTGKNPGKLGVFGWSCIDAAFKRTASITKNQAEKGIWDFLGEHGLKSIVYSMPVHFPPRRINGIFISGPPALPFEEDAFYPVEIKQELEQNVPGFRVEIKHHSDKDELYKNACELLEIKRKACSYLLQKYEWDFFFLHLFRFDSLMHAYWSDLDETHSGFDTEKSPHYREMFEDYCTKADAVIKELCSLADQPNIIIMSDHGFGKVEKWFYPNEWLRKEGLLDYREKKLQKGLSTAGVTSKNVKLFFQKTGTLGVVKKVVSNKYRLRAKRVLPEKSGLQSFSAEKVNWENTTAFASPEVHGTGQIYINNKGRFLRGIVSPEEKRAKMEEIAAKLKKFAEENGLSARVNFPEELYSGNKLKFAPDITVDFNNYEVGISGSLGGTVLEPWNESGHAKTGIHRREGILIAAGPDIKGQGKIKASILDIAPSVLKLFGIDAPAELDGKDFTQAP